MAPNPNISIGKVLNNDAAVALSPNSARISGSTGPTEVVSGRKVMPTKKRGIAFKINFCWDFTVGSDTITPSADEPSLAGETVHIILGS
jgi:hypothetical protein